MGESLEHSGQKRIHGCLTHWHEVLDGRIYYVRKQSCGCLEMGRGRGWVQRGTRHLFGDRRVLDRDGVLVMCVYTVGRTQHTVHLQWAPRYNKHICHCVPFLAQSSQNPWNLLSDKSVFCSLRAPLDHEMTHKG